jgi:hypothetical protein
MLMEKPETRCHLPRIVKADLAAYDPAFADAPESLIEELMGKRAGAYRVLAELCLRCGALGAEKRVDPRTSKAFRAARDQFEHHLRSLISKARKRRAVKTQP